MNLRQILLIIRLRWWLVLLLFALTVAGAVIYTLVVPKRYSSTATLLLDIKTDPLLAALAPNLANPSYMATQSEIIRSDRVATRVVKMLGLTDNPAAVAQWREETSGRIPLETYFGELMQKALVVEPSTGSSVLALTYVAADPKFASVVANSYARAYLDLTVEFRVGPAREYATFFDERLKTLRGDLEAAQGRLGDFQKKNGIVVSSERLDMETARLTSLETALASAMTEGAETTSRKSFSGTESSVDVQQSAAVQSLKGDLARAETKRNEISTTYGPNHPVRIQIEAQISELRGQLSREIARVSAATSNVSRISGQKIGELRTLIDTQKKAVLSMRTQRDEASVLLKDLETAQRAYEAVAQRRTQLANETQAEQATARILSPAVEPLTFSQPNVKKVIAIALLLGLALGVGAALAWEMLDRRVRSEADLMTMEGIPVLGVMSSRKGAGEIRRLPPARRPPPMPPQLTMEAGN